MGGTKASSHSKQPDCRPSRQRAKTLPPVHLSDTISEQDDYMDESSGFRLARGAGVPSTLGVQQRTSQEAFLTRHGTLLSAGATTLKRTVELKSLLGNVNSRLPPGAQILRQPHGQEESTSLEQAKSRARVEIDVVPYSNICVEGGIFKGFIKLRIRPRMSKESAVSISDGKLRIIGFETVEGDYHEFFQYSAAISTVAISPLRMYVSPPDSEGFCEAQEGVHKLEFEMPLPLGGVRRSKGPFYGQSGIAVRYIALVSIKVKDEFNKRSIAHFYRDCEIWPRLNPSAILAPAGQPIKATTSKSLFMGGTGLVQLTASLHRSSFIAGALVSVDVEVKNDSKKLIKSLTLTLYRSTAVFKRNIPRDLSSVVRIDIDGCQTDITRKAVASSTLEMTQGFPRGHASAGGWWPGIPSGERLAFSHLLLIPPDALTHTREQLIAVEYTIRVSLNAKTLTTDVCVDLPIRIVNLLSLDPPPSCNERSQSQPSSIRRSQSQTLHANSTPASPSYEHYDDLCDSDASEDDCGKSYSEDESQPEAQLGNLSMREDAEDLVHHAIVSAQIDDRPEHALQDECIEDHSADTPPEECEEREPGTREPGVCSEPPELQLNSEHDHPSRSNRPRGQSSFARRVQQKLEVAAAARQPRAPDLERERPESELHTTEDPPASKDTKLSLDVPPASAISRVSGYQVASSSFLDDRYFGATSQTSGLDAGNACSCRSRVLPNPPIVGLPFPEMVSNLSALGITTFRVADKEPADLGDLKDVPSCSLEQLKQQMKPKRPVITPGASAGSVKDRIRELEERVQAPEEQQ